MPGPLHLQPSKDILTLKPILPTQFWTFDNALSLLKSCSDPYILNALDEFLHLNRQLLLNPAPFKKGSEKTPLKPDLKSITLRNITYSEIAANNIKDAEKLHNILDLDIQEVLRIIIQTSKKIPERKVYDFDKLKSKLPDDREKYLEQERLHLYASKVLRERRIILKIVVELLNNKSNTYSSSKVQNLGKEIFLSKAYIERVIDTIKDCFQLIVSQPYESEPYKLTELISREITLFVIDLIKVLIELTIQNPIIDSKLTTTWFNFMQENNFISALAPYFRVQEAYSLIHGLGTIVSISFLDLDNAYPDPDDNKITSGNSTSTGSSYLSQPSTFSALNSIITNPDNSNSVVLYSWSIILLRNSYYLEEHLALPSTTKFLQEFPAHKFNSVINELNVRCLKLNVYEDIYTLNESLKFDNLYSAILSTVILAAMPLVSLTPQVSKTIESVLKASPNSVIEKFFDNEATVNQIILARAKFPLSLTPYLKIANINGNFAFHEFSELKSFIQLFKKSEFESLYQIDDENTDLISLTKLIDVYPPFEANKKLSLVLSSGTKAKILPTNNEDEVLVTFLYKYNGWAFLGRILQNVSKSFNDQDDDKVDFIVNISNLLTKVVSDADQNQVSSVLESMSTYTDNSDILEVLLRLFEQSLHSRNVHILTPILGLLTELIPTLSNRIWPYLSKSSLLSNSGKEGFMTTIFGSIEMISGDYSFTVALIKLFEGLIQNCLTSKDDYPSKSKSSIVEKFVSHLILIFESFTHCKFTKSHQKMEIGVLILDAFSNILTSVYGIKKGEKKTGVESSVTPSLDTSALAILDSFLITKNEYSRASVPILNLIESLSTNFNIYELNDLSGFWYELWIRCTLSFSKLVVSIRYLTNYEPSSFERELFKKLPQLVSTYSQFEPLRKDIIDLISILAKGNWNSTNKPSLLSHLGNDYSKILLCCVITDLGNSFDDYKLKVSLYDFICSVLEGEQEGLSVLFSGRDIFGTTESKEKDQVKVPSLLKVLKKNVKDVKYYPNAVSIHLLDALSLAYNSWNTIKEEDDDIEFIEELLTRIQLSLSDKPKTFDDYISRCYEQKIISKIGEIISLILFTTRNEKIQTKIIAVITSSNFIEILKDKFSIKDYSPLHHANVSQIFENFAPQYSLDQFVATLGKRNRFGIANVYNLGLLDGLFDSNPQWSRIRHLIIESSINIQYLDSQIGITKSFGALLTVFCRRFGQSLNGNLLQLVLHLLKTNYIEGIPSHIFEEIFQERIEVAFYLIYTITHDEKISKSSIQTFEIIKVSLDLLSSSNANFLSSLSTSSGHYRQLLRIIYCCLQISKDDETLLIEYFSVFRDLFNLIITKGTKVLLVDIQNEVYLKRNQNPQQRNSTDSDHLNEKINDLQLILSILKLFIGMKSSNNMRLEMARHINDNETIPALLNLFALSHTIQVNDEHIFSQLSLMFIQELMTIEVIAEKFVSSGLFITLVESSISLPIRSGGLNVTYGNEYHKLWINGILPIFIISLNKLGLGVLKEVCLGLQMFGKQIESCIESWSKDSSSIKISTSTLIETSQILVLFDSLQSMDVAQFLSEQELASLKILPGLENESKREEFVDYLNNLLKHPKFLTSRVIPSSIEEQRIFENGGAVYDKFVNTLIEEIRDLKDFFN